MGSTLKTGPVKLPLSITIVTAEKNIWVKICSKIENIIKKYEGVLQFQQTRTIQFSLKEITVWTQFCENKAYQLQWDPSPVFSGAQMGSNVSLDYTTKVILYLIQILQNASAALIC